MYHLYHLPRYPRSGSASMTMLNCRLVLYAIRSWNTANTMIIAMLLRHPASANCTIT